MPKKTVIKKFSLLGLLSLFLFSLIANSLLIWVSPDVRAGPGRTEIENIEGLESLSLDFGASQNSLVLSLDGVESRQIFFGLERIHSRGNARTQRPELFFEYEAPFRADLAYRLEEGDSQPSNCQIQPLIKINAGSLISQPKVDGYRQTWRNYDLSGRELEVTVQLPLLNAATENIGDDCLILTRQLVWESDASVPLFTLIGAQAAENSCSGLEIYGRGGSDLEIARAQWVCYDVANLSDEDRDKFAEIENPPFARSYIFIEIRDDDKCGSRLLLNADDFDNNELNPAAEWQDWHDECKNGQYDQDESRQKTLSLKLANGTIFDQHEDPNEAVNQADTGLQQGAPLAGSVVDSCEFNLSTSLGIGWLICQIFSGISNALEVIEGVIKDYLTLEPEDYQPQYGEKQGYTFKQAWNNVRNLMTFAIVGTALFMVISTALDMGFFKNYTVKKYLPRLVAGIILMQFSWALGDFFIQATNLVGNLMETILFAALPEARNFGLNNIFDGDFTTFLAGLGGAFVLSKTWMLILPLSVTALAAFSMGFLFLVARKYLLILLLILGPLGLALWVLPGNDKAWRFYAKTFMYLLLMYPMIVMVLAAGKIFAYLIMIP